MYICSNQILVFVYRLNWELHELFQSRDLLKMKQNKKKKKKKK